MTRHTQGPWVIHDHGDKRHLELAIMSGIDNVKVGSAYSGHVGWDTAKANALLIATAPDLLKAAKIGLRYIESEMGSDTTERDFVLTAIKKAEGTL